jgi:hypothetical protein
MKIVIALLAGVGGVLAQTWKAVLSVCLSVCLSLTSAFSFAILLSIILSYVLSALCFVLSVPLSLCFFLHTLSGRLLGCCQRCMRPDLEITLFAPVVRCTRSLFDSMSRLLSLLNFCLSYAPFAIS